MNVVVILTLLMIVGAIIAIETRGLLASVVCVGAVGFLVSVAFLFLGAPDVAITQLVVEVLCLVILIRATIRRDLTGVTGYRDLFGLVVTVAMVLTIGLVAARFLIEFPTFGQSVMDRFGDSAPSTTYLRTGLSGTGAANAVTAVLLDFRAYDTIGEATVLFAAILGAVAVLRGKARKTEDEPDSE